MSHPLKALVIGIAFASSVTVVDAHASIADCGNIDVQASAKCKVVTSGCDLQCTQISFQAACAGKLEGGCETTCDKLPEFSCTGSCEADCNTQCTATPATFDCEGSCTGTCQGTCAGKCATASDQASCEASCKATCTGECHGSCTGTPATVDCAGKCEASCQGSCKADLNMDCQTQCQADGSVKCEADLQGGCKLQCAQPSGAIFCDGQFVDNGGNAEKCIDALNAYLEEHVDASASGSCSGNTCEGQAAAKVSCAVSSPAGQGETTGSGFLMTALAGVCAAIRRKRRGAR